MKLNIRNAIRNDIWQNHRKDKNKNVKQQKKF